MSQPQTQITLRPANQADVEAIAQVWYAAWGDGHTGNVPAALHPYRTLDHFRARVPSRISSTTVATIAGTIVGFVTIHDDELEQIFVAKEARGTGAAVQLIDHAEQQIAQHYKTAWLAVVEGNDRALSFYQRQGWHDAGPIDYQAEVEGGQLTVPTRRYEKHLTT
jgi:GNAT superfamily N-acetyltransferase